ncbi:MAG: winged helix-turn-helix domain-containing protein, partial [bacterium]
MDGWLIEPALNRLSLEGEAIQIEPRIMHVLVCLAASSGRVVSRTALLDVVWSKAVVNEEALTQAISHLRRVFGDDPRSARIIQTIHKSGYRLLPPVVWEGPASGGSAAAVPTAAEAAAVVPTADAAPASAAPTAVQAPKPPAGPRFTRTRVAVLLGALMVILVVVSVMATLPRSRMALLRKPVVWEALPLTSYPGHEIHPAISPDGTRTAFAWARDDGGNYDIYVKQRNTETPLRLTETEDVEFCPAWSPDGTEIAYARVSDSTASIWIVPAIGGPSRRVTVAGTNIKGIDWSPDGATLVYSAVADPLEPARVVVHFLETGESRAVAEPLPSSRGDIRPVFSPDGKRIAFARADRTGLDDLYVIGAAGGSLERITHSQHSIAGLDWTADGKSIVFCSAASWLSDTRLWRVNLDDGSLAWLPTVGHRPSRPSVATKGRGLVYEDLSLKSDIMLVPVGKVPGTSRAAARPVIASTQHDYGPQFSPTGRLISFISTRSGSPQVWICDSDGADPRQVTRLEQASIWSPCWSYDERYIAFGAAPEQVTGIYVAEVESGALRCISTADRHELPLGWSRDGRWLYCKSDLGDAWWVRRVRLDGSESADIMEKDVFRLAESMAGDRLIYSRSDVPGVWSASLDGADERCLID